MNKNEKCPKDPKHTVHIEQNGKGRTLVCYACKARIRLTNNNKKTP